MVPLFVCRLPGATYTSQPRMGFTPRCLAWSWKITDENMLPCSVTASAGILRRAAWSSSSSMRHAPSSNEYSVCR